MSEKLKPKIIAWSRGLQVIPFEHVVAVDEAGHITDGLLVMVDLKTSNPTGYVIKPKDAQDFIDQYNNYLAIVESITVSIQLDDVPDGKVVIK